MSNSVERKKELFSTFVFALLFQFCFLLMCTVYRDMIMLSDPFFRLPAPELREQFWALYQNNDLPYDLTVGIVGAVLNIVALISLPWKGLHILRRHSKTMGKKCWVVALIGLLLCLWVIWYYQRVYTGIYYYYMSWVAPEIVSITYIILYLLMVRSQKRSVP